MLRDGMNEGNFSSPYGLVNTSHYQIDGVYHYGAYEPAYKDVLAFLNKLYAEKLLDNNLPSNTDDTSRAAMINGDAALTIGATSWVAALTSAATAENYNLLAIQALSKERGEEPLFGQGDPVVTLSYWNFITEDCKDVETAMKFLNYMQTEEGRLLGNFGEEGVTFEYVDGKPTFNDFVNKNPDGYTRDQLMRVHGFINWGCIHLREMSEQRFPMQAQRDAINTWFTPSRDSYVILNDAIDASLINEYTSLWTDIETYINESRVRFITGETSLDAFDQYIDTLRSMGMDRVMEIRQISYDQNN